jgi:hypothetical protein
MCGFSLLLFHRYIVFILLLAGLLKMHLAYRMVNARRLSFLTFFKPCTISMDTLQICKWLFRIVRTFLEKSIFSWTWSIFNMFWKMVFIVINWQQQSTLRINVLEQPGPFCPWIKLNFTCVDFFLYLYFIGLLYTTYIYLFHDFIIKR